jgi:hypothetical protein
MNDFSNWLQRFAAAMGLQDTANLHLEKTMQVHGVICTFVAPSHDRQDHFAVLVDAGALSFPADNRIVRLALTRNFENFLHGAPMFLLNPDSKHLVIGQRFSMARFTPHSFAPLLEGLALQALAWRARGASACP